MLRNRLDIHSELHRCTIGGERSSRDERPFDARSYQIENHYVPRFTIIWLDRESQARCRATRSDEAATREFARQLTTEGHGDVRYQRPGDPRWRAVRAKARKVRPKRETPFPPEAKAIKERRLREGKGSDALDKRLPGSFESRK